MIFFKYKFHILVTITFVTLLTLATQRNEKKLDNLIEKTISLNKKVSKRHSKSKQHKSSKQIKHGYYCSNEKDLSMIKLSPKRLFHLWSITDGTQKYLDQHPPTMTGTYTINTSTILLNPVKNKKGVTIPFILKGPSSSNFFTVISRPNINFSFYFCSWQADD